MSRFDSYSIISILIVISIKPKSFFENHLIINLHFLMILTLFHTFFTFLSKRVFLLILSLFKQNFSQVIIVYIWFSFWLIT